MVKKNNNNDNEKNGGTGYEFKQTFYSLQPRGFMTSNKHETARFDFLFDDDKKLSDPIDRSPVRSQSLYLMTFIIGVKSYMRVTNVTLNPSLIQGDRGKG